VRGKRSLRARRKLTKVILEGLVLRDPSESLIAELSITRGKTTRIELTTKTFKSCAPINRQGKLT
jgi:hypothetical protein